MAEQTQEDSVETRLASYFATQAEPEEASAPAAAEGPATDDAVEDGEQPAEDSLEEIDWEDGQKYRVPKPLKEGFMRQQDYTRKTQELAELRKHAQVAAEAANAMQQFQAATADEQRELARVQSDIERYKSLDWSSLDTDTYIKAKHQLDTLKERAGEIQQGLGAKAQQFTNWRQQQAHQVLQSGENYLKQTIPGWGVEAKQEVRSQALASGYTDAELEQVIDPRFVRLAWKAAQFDKLQAGKTAAVQQASKAPPVLKPGATNNQAARESKYKDARTRLKKSGDLRDAAALFMMRG